MNLSKFFLLTLLLIIGTVSTNSYANIVYQNSSTEAGYPIDKKKPVKKKRERLRKKVQKKFFFKKAKKINRTQTAGEIIGTTVLILLFLLPIILVVIGGITGGLGWIIAGSILIGLWLIWGYVLIFSKYSWLPYLGLIIFLFFFLACFALFLWALITVLPLILTLSIVFGSIAILGFLLLVFITLMNI